MDLTKWHVLVAYKFFWPPGTKVRMMGEEIPIDDIETHPLAKKTPVDIDKSMRSEYTQKHNLDAKQKG